MIPGQCPGCGLRGDLDVFQFGSEVNPALAAALNIPAPLGGRVLQYLRLFSPPKKALAVSKVTRLLTELATAFKSAEVEHKGQVYAAPQPIWERAIDDLLNDPPTALPLTNHRYLFAVVAGLAQKVAGQQEYKQEEARRHQTGPRQGQPQSVADVITPAARSKPPAGWRENAIAEAMRRNPGTKQEDPESD